MSQHVARAGTPFWEVESYPNQIESEIGSQESEGGCWPDTRTSVRHLLVWRSANLELAGFLLERFADFFTLCIQSKEFKIFILHEYFSLRQSVH